jgi:hypothetical protein
MFIPAFGNTIGIGSATDDLVDGGGDVFFARDDRRFEPWRERDRDVRHREAADRRL